MMDVIIITITVVGLLSGSLQTPRGILGDALPLGRDSWNLWHSFQCDLITLLNIQDSCGHRVGVERIFRQYRNCFGIF